MINSNLLKEAIADAKAVRATALANAKAALEEAFAPRFEAMFAEKLKEESEEEQEESMDEVSAPNQVSGAGGEAKGPKTKDVSKGQPKKKSDAATNFKTVHMGCGPTDVPAADNKIDEAAEEEGKIEEAGLTSEDLDEIIRELEQEVSGEEGMPPMGMPGEEDEAAAAPAPVAPAPEMEAPPVEPDGDEAMPPMAAAPAPEMGMGEVPPAPVAPAPEMGMGGEVDPMAAAAPVAPEGEVAPAPVAPAPEDEINLDELLAALNEESEEEEEGKVDEGKLPPWLKKKGEKEEKGEKEDEKDEVDEAVSNGVPTNNLKGQDKSGGVKGYPTAPQDASKKQLTGKNHNVGGAGNMGTGAVGGLTETTKYKVALKESYKVIEYLRGQINEVNLLNAKLLYTNKLFKEFAGVLDDPYRMKIVESFDLTKNVREVKLAYALLAESLNFGKTINSTKPIVKTVKPVAKSGVKQITEGMTASKPVSSTKPSTLITEGNEMALRFKKLAGIKG